MGRPRVFISFATKDREGVRRLFASLESQPVDVWDYSSEGQEIPGGMDILEYLQERVESCDVFVPVISGNSFDSRYAKSEVSCALRLSEQGKLRIIPLVLAGATTDAGSWPSPYRALSDIRHFTMNLDSRARLGEAVYALCRAIGVEPVTFPVQDPRLPFMDRFTAEIKGRFAGRPDREIGIYRRLERLELEFQEAFEVGDYPAALGRIGYFVHTCEYEFQQERFYYPYLVKAVCQVCCGRVAQAWETLDDVQGHPMLDENLFGLKGYIRQRQGAYREALAYYREAARRDPEDPAARAGMLMNALLCGERVDLKEVLSLEKSALITDPEDRAKVRALEAFAMASLGLSHDAEARFRELIAEGRAAPDLVVSLAHVLMDLRRPREAVLLLEENHVRFPADGNLLHALASLCHAMGDWKVAIRHFGNLIAAHPDKRQYRVDAAQVHWTAGDRAAAAKTVEPILDGKSFPLPASVADFYYDGFANYLCGRIERAEYDFTRSGRGKEYRYEAVLTASGAGR
jgi:tetratricopeptide (TPR) repeat protein